jgi:glycosyltransferase involved in cell wall biosynthesis
MNRPLNFLHLTTFYPPYSFGGDAMYIYRLAHALGDSGHNVDVIHCTDAYHLLHPGKPEMSFPGHPGVSVHSLSSKYGFLSPFLTQQTGHTGLKKRRILEVLNSKPYDVVHFHNMSLIGPEALKFEPQGKRAVKLYTAHEHWLICPTHVLWKFGARPCEKPECFRCTLLAKRPPQWWRYSSLLENSSRYVDQFLAPSRFTANMHAERGFSRPVAHLPYFIERADENWKAPGPRPQQRPYFLFVGRLEVIKGLQTLIEIWDRVPDCDLLVAGTGDFESMLRKLALNKPNIKFLGQQSQKQLGDLYYHALACVLPSLTYETFGMIIIEAYARKTPVIVRDLGPFPEAVEDSGGGFVYRTDDQLLDALNRIARSPALRTELGEKGYAAFARFWSKEAHLKLYYGLLRDLASAKFGYVPWESEDDRRAVPSGGTASSAGNRLSSTCDDG